MQVAQLEDQLLHLNGLVTTARDRQAEAEKQLRLQRGVATELQSQVTIRDQEISRLTETVCVRLNYYCTQRSLKELVHITET